MWMLLQLTELFEISLRNSLDSTCKWFNVLCFVFCISRHYSRFGLHNLICSKKIMNLKELKKSIINPHFLFVFTLKSEKNLVDLF